VGNVLWKTKLSCTLSKLDIDFVLFQNLLLDMEDYGMLAKIAENGWRKQRY
jgi:hypothetical protein